MRMLALFLIGLAVGAFFTAATINALSKRGAHPRASMVVLAYHVDALHRLDDEQDCAGDAAQRHWQQIAFAAREIDHAFAAQSQASSTFRRRSEQFGGLAERPANALGSCSELSGHLRELEQGCQACHREFR